MMPLDVHQLDWRGWEKERERENRKEGLYFTIALFPTPPLPSDGGLYSRWEADTLRRDTLQPLEPRILERKVFSTPSSPWRRRENGGQRRVGWGGRCHCTALGEGHYSEQGEPVTSAPTPGIDPYPPPPPPPPPPRSAVSDARGVQCTVRFSTFIIRCARAPAEGTRRWRPSRFSGEGLVSIERLISISLGSD